MLDQDDDAVGSANRSADGGSDDDEVRSILLSARTRTMTEHPGHQTVVRTADFEQAVESLRTAFGDVDLRRAEDQPSRFAMESVRVPGITSTRWAFSGVTGGSRVDDEGEPVLLTGVVLGGSAHLWSPQSDVDTSRPFLYPDVADSELARPDFANLGISRSIVEARASAITGVDRFELRFSRTAPIDPAMDVIWRDTMAYAARTAAALVDLPDTVLARAALLDLTATMLLRTFPNTTLDAANQRSVTSPRRSAMRRALQYIDDHLESPLTVPDIARAAGLSTRGLYAGFQRDLGESPMAHLRTARLTAVRDELRQADPATTSVAEVAARWGFVGGSRFTSRYVALFRESPADTLLH